MNLPRHVLVLYVLTNITRRNKNLYITVSNSILKESFSCTELLEQIVVVDSANIQNNHFLHHMFCLRNNVILM